MKQLTRLFLWLLFLFSLLALLARWGMPGLWDQESWEWTVTIFLTVLMLLSGLVLSLSYFFPEASKKEVKSMLDQIARFDIKHQAALSFSPSRDPKIRALQDYLSTLTRQLKKQYSASEQFTQNASHELQTPLAVIKGNIDMLLQSPRLGEKDIEHLGVILQNTNKLSKLTGALVLLSKIENRPFPDEREVNLNKLTEEILYNFKDLMEMQELKVSIQKNGRLLFFMSQSIAEILLANLIQNAIRHNVERGNIQISIAPEYWRISNTGMPLDVPPSQLFNRFERRSEAVEGLGLGLNIVQSICDRYQIRINYWVENDQHIVRLDFPAA